MVWVELHPVPKIGFGAGLLRHDCHLDPRDWSSRASIGEVEQQEADRRRRLEIEFRLGMLSGKLYLWRRTRASHAGGEI